MKELKESMGISNVVLNATKEILSAIIKDAKRLNWNNDIKQGEFKLEVNALGNTPLYIRYLIHYAKTLTNAKGLKGCSSNGTSLGVGNLVYVEETRKFVDYKGLLQHEVEHIYQALHKGDLLKKGTTEEEVYDVARQLRNSKNAIEKIVGTTIYYSFRFERDAYINSIYRDILNNPQQNPQITLKKNSVYQNIQVIKDYILENSSWDEKYERIVNLYFGQSLDWFIKIAQKVYKEYMNKIGKMLTRASDDIGS